MGIGMAASTRDNLLMASKCSVALDKQGVLTVRRAMTDIGISSYTVVTQVAAEMLGRPISQVRMELGDSDLPQTHGSGGSCGAASPGSGLFDAFTNLAGQAGVIAANATFAGGRAGGRVAGGGRSSKLGLEASGEIKPGSMTKKYSQQGCGAHCAEVAVDRDTGEIRPRRLLGVFAADRSLNQKIANSEAVGAMIWDIGWALHENALVPSRYGYFVNHDRAEYHVFAHANIPAIEAHFLQEVDDKSNPVKIKGGGELRNCGAGAALANAAYNACGVWIREFLMPLDKMLAGLDRQKMT